MRGRSRSRRLLLAFLGTLLPAGSPVLAQQPDFTRADTLRGTVTAERAWWDVHFYDLHVRVNPADSSIAGWNGIEFRATAPGRVMQIDLQEPLVMDSVILDRVEPGPGSAARDGGSSGEVPRRLTFTRDGNAFFVELGESMAPGDRARVTAHYHGNPVVAIRPPWDGGFIWSRDRTGASWVATANQGLGASVWWPNKDHQTEEPDSMRVAIRVPEPMVNVSNGRLRDVQDHGDGTRTYTWFVSNPINNYNIAVNAGRYAHWSETYDGVLGPLDLDYWVLQEDAAAAQRQFRQVRPMMACFEDWFGPYPFYEDGFKLVQTPHLGMEHQSAIAYGNGFQNGYRGQDLSDTGWGLTWDFIIIHEAGHEWFGNNITAADVADMWVHEGFTNYSENLYVECLYGKEAGADYVIGTRARIGNDRPVIGEYGVQSEGSGDMYYKGGNLLHTIRQLVDDDTVWKSILRGLNREFWHQVVTSAEVEAYVARQSGLDLSRVFDQYLRHAAIPTLEWRLDGDVLRYRWVAEVEGFDMPVRVTLAQGRYGWILPTTAEWREATVDLSGPEAFEVDRNFYVEAVEAPAR